MAPADQNRRAVLVAVFALLHDGWCSASRKEIARLALVSDTTVKRALFDLVPDHLERFDQPGRPTILKPATRVTQETRVTPSTRVTTVGGVSGHPSDPTLYIESKDGTNGRIDNAAELAREVAERDDLATVRAAKRRSYTQPARKRA